jgi:WD40 repeat protein
LWDGGTCALIIALRDHTAPVRACGFSPDGKFLLSGAQDGSLALWNVDERALVEARQAHSGWVVACGVKPDGRLLSLGLEGSLKIWNEGLRPLATWEHGIVSNVVDIGPDGAFAVLGADDGRIVLLETDTGNLFGAAPHEGRLLSCAFAPGGRLIAGSDQQGGVSVLDLTDGRIRARMTLTDAHGTPTPAAVAAVTGDGASLAAVGSDGSIRFWNLERNAFVQRRLTGRGPVNFCAFTGEARHVVTGGSTIVLWDAESGHEVVALTGFGAPALTWAANPVCAQFVVGTEQGEVLSLAPVALP